MNITLKNYLADKGVQGKIILYRDKTHKKKALCEYLATKIVTDKTICVYSAGAFGLYMAKAFPNNKVVVCGKISAEYKKQLAEQSNAVMGNIALGQSVKDFAESNGFLFVDQFNNEYVKEYYKQHFGEILAEVGMVDAFCDCGHSCSTLAGAVESGAKIKFVLGYNGEQPRQNLHHLNKHKDKIEQATTRNFDTATLQGEIEKEYPSFGNIFEATRSISSAMAWLQKNPNKTVLVYVGDSPSFGKDAEI